MAGLVAVVRRVVGPMAVLPRALAIDDELLHQVVELGVLCVVLQPGLLNQTLSP